MSSLHSPLVSSPRSLVLSPPRLPLAHGERSLFSWRPRRSPPLGASVAVRLGFLRLRSLYRDVGQAARRVVQAHRRPIYPVIVAGDHSSPRSFARHRDSYVACHQERKQSQCSIPQWCPITGIHRHSVTSSSTLTLNPTIRRPLYLPRGHFMSRRLSGPRAGRAVGRES